MSCAAPVIALRYFTLDGTHHAGHKGQGNMICRYIIWRHKHARNERQCKIMNRANVARASTTCWAGSPLDVRLNRTDVPLRTVIRLQHHFILPEVLGVMKHDSADHEVADTRVDRVARLA
ncbi:hypothetical protein SUDANB132_00218 [Streptomyces sp. enrichment culture]